MITNLAFAYDYVDAIPWENNPAFAFSGDAEKYLSAFRRVVEVLPTPDLKVKYDDMVWDFNPYFKHMNGDSVKIIFTGLPDEVVDYCKFFVLHKIMMNKKISTVNVRYSGFKSIINQLYNEYELVSFSLITTEDLVDAINRRNVSSSSVHSLYEDLYQVYYFIINNYKLDLPVDVEVLKDLSIKANNLAKRTLDEDKMIARELLIVKVSSTTKNRTDIMNLCQIMGAKIADVSPNTMTLELSDTGDRLELFLSLLRPFSILEVARTGLIAVQKGSGKM